MRMNGVSSAYEMMRIRSSALVTVCLVRQFYLGLSRLNIVKVIPQVIVGLIMIFNH